jgi:hypothetical protein
LQDDVPILLSPFTTPPPKKRKIGRDQATPASSANDSDFLQEESEDDEEVPEGEDASDAAADKAREVIRSLSTETERNIEAIKQRSAMAQASKFLMYVLH